MAPAWMVKTDSRNYGAPGALQPGDGTPPGGFVRASGAPGPARGVGGRWGVGIWAESSALTCRNHIPGPQEAQALREPDTREEVRHSLE